VYDSGDHTYSITSLSAPNAQGFFSIKIPVGADPNHFITVEYRRRLGWDAGIPQDAVLIHEVKSDYVPNHQLPLSYLQTKSTNPNDANWKPGEIFSDVTGNYHVRVLALDPVANLASIEVWQGSALPPPSCVSSLSCAHTGWGPPEMTVACTTTVNFYTSITTGVVATGTYYTTDANTPGPTVTACNGPLSSSSSSCTSFSGTVSLAQWCGLPPPPPPPPKTCQGEATPKSKCSAVWHCCGTDGWSCGLCQ
jgi:hypothetical protein